MQTKFKPHDIVYYIQYPDNSIDINYVVSFEYAKNKYKEFANPIKIEEIVSTCRSSYKCEPVFISEREDWYYVSWMPEKDLYLYTDAAKILFQK